MAKILALEWDTHEIRLVRANLHGPEVTVEEAASFPFSSSDLVLGEGTPPDEANETSDSSLSDTLATALASQDISRANVLIAIPRSGVEVRVLQVPAVPDDELPELVRFQALRQFSTMGENWPLDFIRLKSDSEDDIQSVLATTISPELVDDIKAACEARQSTASRLVLRPFATGSLVQRALGSQLPECCLVVELLGKEADLTVLQANQVAFMRTIRLPSDTTSSLQAQAILGELRRTIAAAQNQMQGQSIGQIVLCGDSELHQQLQTLIPGELSLETISVQPFDQVSLGRSLRDNLPAHPERYTALLGILRDEADSAAHTIDFLSPRKPPEKPSTRRRNLWYGGAIAACLMMAIIVWLGQLSRLDQEISDLERKSRGKDRSVKTGKVVAERIATIEKFTAGNVIWLDELARLSDTEKFPGPEKAITKRISMTTRNEGGGRIAMELNISENAATDWGPSTAKYKDDRHSFRSSSTKDNQKDRDYPYKSNLTITIEPETKKPPAPQSPSTTGK